MNNNLMSLAGKNIGGILGNPSTIKTLLARGVYWSTSPSMEKIDLTIFLQNLLSSRHMKEKTHILIERDVIVGDDKNFIEALRSFKYNNDEIKFIIFTGREEKNQLHYDLVNLLDIKDILFKYDNDEDFIEQIVYAVTIGATFTDTEKFRQLPAATESLPPSSNRSALLNKKQRPNKENLGEKKESEVVEVVEETTIIKTLESYIQIAFAGNTQKIGTSSMALSYGVLLKAEGYKVAVFEFNNHYYETEYQGAPIKQSYFDLLEEEEGIDTKHNEYLAYKGMHIYPSQGIKRNDELLAQIKGSSYDYIILDCGIYDELDFPKKDFNSSHGKIIVTGTKVHENDLTNIFSQSEEVIKSYRFLVNLSDERLVREFQKAVDKKTLFAPYTPNPFNPQEYLLSLIDDLLKTKTVKKKRGLFGRKK